MGAELIVLLVAATVVFVFFLKKRGSEETKTATPSQASKVQNVKNDLQRYFSKIELEKKSKAKAEMYNLGEGFRYRFSCLCDGRGTKWEKDEKAKKLFEISPFPLTMDIHLTSEDPRTGSLEAVLFSLFIKDKPGGGLQTSLSQYAAVKNGHIQHSKMTINGIDGVLISTCIRPDSTGKVNFESSALTPMLEIVGLASLDLI